MPSRANAVLDKTALCSSFPTPIQTLVLAQQNLQRHYARFEAGRQRIQLLNGFVDVAISHCITLVLHVAASKLRSEVVLVVNVIEGWREGQSDDIRQGRGLLEMQQEVRRVLVVR